MCGLIFHIVLDDKYYTDWTFEPVYARLMFQSSWGKMSLNFAHLYVMFRSTVLEVKWRTPHVLLGEHFSTSNQIKIILTKSILDK
uniref:Uncharacterized protein n=1 Tax=Rhizophora mucronata TaxID=61149 RepID=A0A2P2PUG7_RHIMU